MSECFRYIISVEADPSDDVDDLMLETLTERIVSLSEFKALRGRIQGPEQA